jgi:hypothetical protein
MTEISAELLDAARQFLGATSLIKLDADGLPCDPDQGLEFDITSNFASQLIEPLHAATEGPAHQIWVMADLWLRIQTAMKGGHPEPDLGRRYRRMGGHPVTPTRP